jgi:hypothetical protein
VDPFLHEYKNPVIARIIRQLRSSDKDPIYSPKRSREVFDDFKYRWFLTDREDALMFKLTHDTTMQLIEVDEFINLLTSFSTSRDLFTSLEYYLNVTANKND